MKRSSRSLAGSEHIACVMQSTRALLHTHTHQTHTNARKRYICMQSALWPLQRACVLLCINGRTSCRRLLTPAFLQPCLSFPLHRPTNSQPFPVSGSPTHATTSLVKAFQNRADANNQELVLMVRGKETNRRDGQRGTVFRRVHREKLRYKSFFTATTTDRELHCAGI